MTTLSWLDAIEKVLDEEKRALHYFDIAQLIFERQYRPPGTGGATPANTVNKQLNSNINDHKEKSHFAKVFGRRGEFILRKFQDDSVQFLPADEGETGVKAAIVLPPFF